MQKVSRHTSKADIGSIIAVGAVEAVEGGADSTQNGVV